MVKLETITRNSHALICKKGRKIMFDMLFSFGKPVAFYDGKLIWKVKHERKSTKLHYDKWRRNRRVYGTMSAEEFDIGMQYFFNYSY